MNKKKITKEMLWWLISPNLITNWFDNLEDNLNERFDNNNFRINIQLYSLEKLINLNIKLGITQGNLILRQTTGNLTNSYECIFQHLSQKS